MSWAIHHVQLSCPAGSEPELRRFYRELLGMAEVAKPPELAARGGAWFRAGSAELHLGVEDGFRAARKAHPALQLPDRAALQALADRLAAAGVPVHWDGALPGYHRCYTADPVGNRIELLAPVHDR